LHPIDRTPLISMDTLPRAYVPIAGTVRATSGASLTPPVSYDDPVCRKIRFDTCSNWGMGMHPRWLGGYKFLSCSSPSLLLSALWMRRKIKRDMHYLWIRPRAILRRGHCQRTVMVPGKLSVDSYCSFKRHINGNVWYMLRPIIPLGAW